MILQLKHPGELNKYTGDKVWITQSNKLCVFGCLTAVNIDEKEGRHSINVMQEIEKTTRVGKLKRDEGQLIATVYLKNIQKIEVI